MTRVGIAGIGFIGMIHYLAYQRLRLAKVTAIAEPTPERLRGDWTGIKGNFGPAGEQMNLSKVAAYSDWREMLQDPNVDLVDICLPPAMHAEATIAALKAGKNVLCEKPIAVALADGKRMVAAAEKTGKQLYIAHVLPFFPEYQFAYQAAVSGKYGKLLGGTFKRVISDPAWLKHFWDAKICGGPLIDLHIHDAHFIRLLFGMPTSVTSTGRMRGEVVEYLNTQFGFEDSSYVVSAASGTINQQGRSFTHGYEIHLEKATLLFESAVVGGEGKTLMPVTVLDHRGNAKPAKLKGGDEVAAFAAELKEVVRCVEANEPSQLLDGRLALDALTLCNKQTQSVLKRRPVKV